MRAMILAAGRGERMRPLTDTCPKPLLRVGGEALIERLIRQLVGAGIAELVVNHAWLGAQIESALGNGARWQARIRYSPEVRALETAGGIAQALPLLGDAPFLVVNGDIHTDFDFETAHQWLATADAATPARCVLVPNPAHNPDGDFALHDGRVSNDGGPRHTYAGIAMFAPAMFAAVQPGAAVRLAPILRELADAGRLAGVLHAGHWSDVGTPARLAALEATLSDSPGNHP